MRLLFVHQNFPGQFKHLAPALARAGHQVLGGRAQPEAVEGLLQAPLARLRLPLRCDAVTPLPPTWSSRVLPIRLLPPAVWAKPTCGCR